MAMFLCGMELMDRGFYIHKLLTAPKVEYILCRCGPIFDNDASLHRSKDVSVLQSKETEKCQKRWKYFLSVEFPRDNEDYSANRNFPF